MKASKPIERVRDLLRDTKKPYRWSDEELSVWATEGLRDIWRRRPEFTFNDDDIEIDAPPMIQDTTSDVRLIGTFLPCLVNYMCYRAMSRDGEESPNFAVAQQYFGSYLATLT